MQKILVVHDSYAISALLKSRLEYAGFMVDLAIDGKQGLEYAKNETYDLILLDFILPDLNGAEVCKILQQDEHIKKVPIVFMSAKTKDELLKELKDVKIAGIIDLSCDQDQFINAVKKILEASNG